MKARSTFGYCHMFSDETPGFCGNPPPLLAAWIAGVSGVSCAAKKRIEFTSHD